MELHKKEKEKKHALELIRERDELYRQQYNIAPIKLDKPIHHGYVRNLELRDDVKNRKDYPKILEVIKFLGQTKVYHNNRNFITHHSKKSSSEKHAYLKSKIDPRFKFYYTESKRTADIEKIKSIESYLWYHNILFNCSCEEHNNVNNYKLSNFRPHYYFKYPWMLQEITKPHYLTHYTPVYGELESRLHEIKTELNNNNYYSRFINNRSVEDKMYKQELSSRKYSYDKSIVYHSLEELDFTS